MNVEPSSDKMEDISPNVGGNGGGAREETAEGIASEDELDEALGEGYDDEPIALPPLPAPTNPVKAEPISPTSSTRATQAHQIQFPSSNFPQPESSWTPTAFAGPSRPLQSTFKVPPNPNIPQDLSLIAEMVSSHQVVGALPPLHITAAEKRRLVQESMRKGKAKAVEQDVKPVNLPAEEESDSDSDSSSEFLSDEEDEKPTTSVPMTEAEHADIKAGIDQLINGASGRPPPSAEVESDSDDSSDYMTDDEDIEEIGAEVLQGRGTGKGKARLEELMDDDEDGGVAGPIISTNEAPLPPVSQPPIGRLPSVEKLSLAGDVVSWMREKKVEAWLGEQQRAADEIAKMGEASGVESADAEPTDEVEAGEVVDAPSAIKSMPISTPKFNSAGTVVIRAMQERPGMEGWLEEGSVLCWQDGRVLGTVSDTFGPLQSPFYLVRLPPPPHPYPTLADLSSGTRIYYPLNPTYRRFVDMHAVRDPRFKGSDASNFHDEEVGEDEMEWSDDEAEAEARRRRKAKRSGSHTSQHSARGRDRGLGGAARGTHFDYQPDEDGSDAGSMYGGAPDDGDGWSETGSMISTGSGRGRAPPAPYEVDEDMASGGGRSRPYGGEGRGRGQGRQRGRGRGGYDQHGGGRGGRGGRGHDRRSSGGSRGMAAAHGLPPRPETYSPSAATPGYHQGEYPPSTGWVGGHPHPPPPSQHGCSPQQQYSPYPQAPTPPNAFFPQPSSSWAPPSPGGVGFGMQPGGSPGGPAINPKFAAAAAQYSQMLQGPPWGQGLNQHYSE